jgi:hypothetical protein
MMRESPGTIKRHGDDDRSDRMAMIRRWPLVLAAVLLASAGCSSKDKPHTLTLDVKGVGRATLTYVIDGRTTTEPQVTLPWRKDIRLTAPGKDTWVLSIQQEGDGEMSAVAYVDGRPFTSTAGSGGGTSRLSGSVG